MNQGKHIKLIIGVDGTCSIDAVNFTGPSCQDATGEIARALGGQIVEEHAKPEARIGRQARDSNPARPAMHPEPTARRHPSLGAEPRRSPRLGANALPTRGPRLAHGSPLVTRSDGRTVPIHACLVIAPSRERHFPRMDRASHRQ
jgi:hypothetical protein